MELHPDVVVYSLKMLVDPADGSYTPSLLIVSMGDKLSSLKETAVVAVGLQVSVPELYYLERYSKFVHGTGYLAEPYITAASGDNIVPPRQITALSQHVIRKVAVHSGGRHALALTADGRVFSWGEGS